MASQVAGIDFEKWQLKVTTVRERNEFMFNNELLSDVHFLVGSKKARIPAHRYVLAISSPVFFAMFFGRMADDTKEIPVVDTEEECFTELLRYVYTDKCLLTLDNALGVLYLGKKYLLSVLVNKCAAFVEKHLNPDNALTVLCHSRYLGEKCLEEKCWDIIDVHTAKVLQSEYFAELDMETLLLLVQRSSLSVKEISLFHAVKSWAEAECYRKDIEPSPQNQRSVAAEALKYIRYPVMSPVEFADEVARCGLLTSEETTSVFLFFLSSFETKISFTNAPRVPRPLAAQKTYRCSRFKSCCGNDWFCDTRKHDGIKFMTDRRMYIKGVGLYGASKTEGDYKTTVELKEQDRILAQTKATYSSFTHDLVCDILFDESIAIEKNIVYTITVLLKGPCSLSGTNGQREVLVEGAKFTFLEYTSPNGTSLSAGQIPEIIFNF
ncbi:predicted protein [Nematostella vectensis]|uniref:BTB domain-containing protein n=1 Tax=Nematostella vectensis TaxID=45351 RepID=A7RUQ9_NEMVE|nr:BTB/POZ domain-containing protein 6-A [Nematostella vectensis]EDO44741.1 predicted protein [Nematostella vectensis]|eukprot:XP_001636804.1 predicted protein [Nematostella vectensis]